VKLRAVWWHGIAFDLSYDAVNATFSLSGAPAQARATRPRVAGSLLLHDATTGQVYPLSHAPLRVSVGDLLTITAGGA
jgi:hypothetical protein